MKILYIVPFVPWAVKVRSFNLIPRLARRHEIALVCVSDAGASAEQKVWLSKYCKKAVYIRHTKLEGMAHCAAALPTRTPLRIAYCKSKKAKEAVQGVYEEFRPDVVYVERWRALQFVPEVRSAPVVCDPTDSMTLFNRRLMKGGAPWERLLALEEHRKFMRYEGNLARGASVCVFCSRVDMECVKEQAPEVQYELVPNGVDCEKLFFKEESEEEPGRVVFTGSFNYGPNRHAAKYFLEEIFPRVRKDVPEAKFVAVGNGAAKVLTEYRGRAGFEAVDFVPDLRPYLAKAAVAVAPLTVGAGVSNKLAEGFAVGTAVVSTPLACGDLPVTNGQELLIAEGAAEFARQVVRLLRDAGLRRQLAFHARVLAEQQYDWEIVSKKMEMVLQRAAGIGADEINQQAIATA
ncbi:MAG: glycosyltransferase family 4 protein [Terriglobales bacterium]